MGALTPTCTSRQVAGPITAVLRSVTVGRHRLP